MTSAVQHLGATARIVTATVQNVGAKVCGCGTTSLAAVHRRRQALRPCPMVEDRAAALPQKCAEALNKFIAFFGNHFLKVAYL